MGHPEVKLLLLILLLLSKTREFQTKTKCIFSDYGDTDVPLEVTVFETSLVIILS